MITTRNKAKHPCGFRYGKEKWFPIVQDMLNQGALYREIGKKLGVGQSTVMRYAWKMGLVNHLEHRNTARAKLLTKHQDDIRRGLRTK